MSRFEVTVYLGLPTDKVLETKRPLVAEGTTATELFHAMCRINCSGGEWVLTNSRGRDMSGSDRVITDGAVFYFRPKNARRARPKKK